MTLKWGAYLKAIIRPGAKFHDAGLLIKGEVLDVDLAGRLVNRWRLPVDSTGIVESGFRRQGYLEIAIGAVDILMRHSLRLN